MKQPQHAVAKKYCRTQGHISNLVKKVRQNKNLLREMMDMRDQAVVKEDTTKEVIQELLDEDTYIESVQQVVEEVQSRH